MCAIWPGRLAVANQRALIGGAFVGMLLCHWSDSTYTLLGHKRSFSKYAEVGIWNLDPDNCGSNPKPDPKTQNSECKFRDRDSECCPLRICIKLLRRTPSGLRTPTYVKAYAKVTYTWFPQISSSSGTWIKCPSHIMTKLLTRRRRIISIDPSCPKEWRKWTIPSKSSQSYATPCTARIRTFCMHSPCRTRSKIEKKWCLFLFLLKIS